MGIGLIRAVHSDSRFSERFCVFTEVFQSTFNDAVNLSFNRVRGPILLGNGHPADLNRLSDRLVDVARPKEVRHLVAVASFAERNRREHGTSPLMFFTATFANPS